MSSRITAAISQERLWPNTARQAGQAKNLSLRQYRMATTGSGEVRTENLAESALQLAHHIEKHFNNHSFNHGLSLSNLSELQPSFSELLGMDPEQFRHVLRVQQVKQVLRAASKIESFNTNIKRFSQTDNRSCIRNTILFAMCKTELGILLMAAAESGVCSTLLADNYTLALKALRDQFPQAKLQPTPADTQTELDSWIIALAEYVDGRGAMPQLPLHLQGTEFQLSVWRFLSSISEGQTVSYQDVAKSIGKPTAFRAVANACGANKVAILVPCHRVLRSNGSLGGYRWGASRKESLLSQEKLISA